MGGKVTELPVQQISADDGFLQRLREWNAAGSVPDNAVWVGNQPFDPRDVASYNAQLSDLATAKGGVSKGLAHILGPLMMAAAPESVVGNAALQGASGALSGYANDPEHPASHAVFKAWPNPQPPFPFPVTSGPYRKGRPHRRFPGGGRKTKF